MKLLHSNVGSTKTFKSHYKYSGGREEKLTQKEKLMLISVCTSINLVAL